MDRYKTILLRFFSGQPTDDPAVRQMIYARARSAVLATFAEEAQAEIRASELEKLDQAIRDIEAEFPPEPGAAYAEPAPEAVPKPSGSKPSEPKPPEPRPEPPRRIEPKPEPPSPPAPSPAGPAAAPTPATVAGEPESARPADARPDPAGPPSEEPRPAWVPADQAPDAALFTAGPPPEAPFVREDVEAKVSGRMKLGVALLAVAAGVYLLVNKPDLLSVAKPGMSSVAPPPQPAAPKPLAETEWRFEDRKGTIRWQRELDRASQALRQARKEILVGRADLSPGGPRIEIAIIPTDETSFNRGDVVELRYEGSGPEGIASLDTMQVSINDAQPVEADGVMVRSGSSAFAFIFTKDKDGRTASRDMLKAATVLQFPLVMNDNRRGTLDIAVKGIVGYIGE